MKLKAALKDVARVHRVPHSIVNYITAMIDDGTDWTGLFRQAAFNRKLRDFIQTYPLVIEDVQGLLGQPKAASIHASAIVVTPDTRDGRPAECFDSCRSVRWTGHWYRSSTAIRSMRSDC